MHFFKKSNLCFSERSFWTNYAEGFVLLFHQKFANSFAKVVYKIAKPLGISGRKMHFGYNSIVLSLHKNQTWKICKTKPNVATGCCFNDLDTWRAPCNCNFNVCFYQMVFTIINLSSKRIQRNIWSLQEQHSIIHHWLLPRFHLLQLCAKRNLGKEAQLISFH